MAETTLEQRPASPYAILFTCSWGAADNRFVARYCRWTSDITIGGDTFIASPTLDAEIDENHGGTNDKPAKVLIDNRLSPFDRMILGFRHPKVQTRIEQVDPLNAATTRRELFFGHVSLITKNPSGRTGLCRATIAGIKSRLADIRVGVPGTTTCIWKFRGIQCQADGSSWDRVGTITSIGSPKRNTVTINIPAVSDPVTELANVRYRRGMVVVDGLPIMIRRSRQNFKFDLFNVPPPWWVGMDVKVLPGCDKRLATCRVWDREESFAGVGIRTPARNPVFSEA